MGRPHNHNHIWSPSDDELLLDLLECMPIDQIAEEMGRDPLSITRRARDIGIEFPQYRER